MTYTQKLQRAVSSSNSLLCVGLDPDPQKIPAPLKDRFSDPSDLVFEFCRRIIQATKVHTPAYKLNLAFFEALGSEGFRVFERLLDEIPNGKVLIADAKRGDIGSTAQKYRETYFDRLNVDAITLNPLMGLDTLDPFLTGEEKAVYVLAMTSNIGAADFLQQRFLGRSSLGEYIAELIKEKQSSAQTHLGMVIGATQSEMAESVLKANSTAHLLIPGIGAQGGRIEDLEQLLQNHRGIPLISSSRAIIYAGGDHENWEELVAKSAAETKFQLKNITAKYV